MRVPTALAACSLVLSGCVDATTTRIGPPSSAFDRPRFAPDEVAVYRTEDQVPGEYREVALLHVTGSETWSTESEIDRKIREEAGRAGANAVILQPVPELSNRERLYARTKNFDMGREGRAIAIYVLPKEDARAARPRTPVPPEPKEVIAFYRIELEDGTSIPAVEAGPAGIGQIEVVLPDDTIRYVTSSKARQVVDENGRDWTAWLLDERRRLPRATPSF